MARYLEKGLFPVLRKLGIVFYAYSPLAGGFLSKSLTDLDAGAGRFNKDVIGRMYNDMYNKLSLREGLELWSAIAEKEGVTKAELAYRWVAHHSALTDTDDIVFGASSLDQLGQTVGSIWKGRLSAEAAERIDALWETVKAEAPVDNFVWSQGKKRFRSWRQNNVTCDEQASSWKDVSNMTLHQYSFHLDLGAREADS